MFEDEDTLGAAARGDGLRGGGISLTALRLRTLNRVCCGDRRADYLVDKAWLRDAHAVVGRSPEAPARAPIFNH